MKRKIQLPFAVLALTALPSLSFAFFCPTNFSQIEFGMTVDQVTQLCGKPDTQKESTKENENVPQEWSYFIQQTVSMGNNQNAQGTLKTTVTFDESGKAINISANGIGVGATSLCGSSIQLGDTRDKIKSACGDPAFVNKQTAPTNGNPPPPPTKVVEFNYSSVTPPATLIFENGKLTEKK